jgi:hypothetical protein
MNKGLPFFSHPLLRCRKADKYEPVAKWDYSIGWWGEADRPSCGCAACFLKWIDFELCSSGELEYNGERQLTADHLRDLKRTPATSRMGNDNRILRLARDRYETRAFARRLKALGKK